MTITISDVLTATVASLGLWLFVAALTEALTEILKSLFPLVVKDKITYVISLAIGVVLAFAFTLNPFGLTGASSYVSTLAAGILASRGANYLHGVLKKLTVAGKGSL